MHVSEPNSSKETSYSQTLMDWGLKGIAFFVTTPEEMKETGKASVNLLEGFEYREGAVSGHVEAEKVRDVIKQAMDPIKSFFRAGMIVTSVLFFSCRIISFVPIVPGVLLIFSIASGIITWDVHVVCREMHHAFTHFNRIYLNAKYDRSSEVNEPHETSIDFERFVTIIDGYSQQILSGTWLINGNEVITESLTSWRPHLIDQISNQKEQERESPWKIAAKYLPILPLICRVINVMENKSVE